MEAKIVEIITQIIFFSFIAVIFVLAIFRYLKIRNRVPRSLSMVTLMITVPKEVKPVTEEAKKEEKEIISVAEQMYANL